MKERPILFSAPMVLAILDGRKTQTRRVVKNPETYGCLTGDCPHTKQSQCDAWLSFQSPYGIRGDVLWVRENFGYAPGSLPEEHAVSYKVDFKVDGWQPMRPDWTDLTVWRPSIHMPRWASRITLEVTAVRVERLQDISEEDALEEGFELREHFIRLWDELNSERGFGFDANPWVWCIEFRRIKP